MRLLTQALGMAPQGPKTSSNSQILMLYSPVDTPPHIAELPSPAVRAPVEREAYPWHKC